MRYYIIKDNQVCEVPETSYDYWHKNYASNYKLPDFAIPKDDFVYSVETMFKGAIDVDEEVLPFILFYFKDELLFIEGGVKSVCREDTIEHFSTFEELEKRYFEIKESVSGK